MKKSIVLLICIAFLCGCNGKKKEHQAAMQRYEQASQLAQAGQLNAAKIELDSVHILYPKQVEIRRLAKHLEDSIGLVEAERNLQYADSLLAIVLPEVDKQVKSFKYEKKDLYEDHGRYVHRLLTTGRNDSRCFLQCYVTDDFHTILKSYYFGSSSLEQTGIELSANDNTIGVDGENHSFQAEGWHEILTVSEEDAMRLLEFVDMNRSERVKVTLHGKRNYAYYLQDVEKTALVETRQLAISMQDAHCLEQMRTVSEKQIERYQNKKAQ